MAPHTDRWAAFQQSSGENDKPTKKADLAELRREET
jgi:hypothetical protein